MWGWLCAETGCLPLREGKEERQELCRLSLSISLFSRRSSLLSPLLPLPLALATSPVLRQKGGYSPRHHHE